MLIPIVIVTILVIFVDVAYRSFSEEKRAKNEIAILKTLKIESADDWNRELTKIEEGKLKELGGNITAGILKSLIMVIYSADVCPCSYCARSSCLNARSCCHYKC